MKKNPNDGLGSETTTTTSNPKPKVSLNEKSSASGSNLESKQADPLEKPKVSNDIQNLTVDKAKIKSVPSKPLGDKEAGNVQKDSKDKEVVDDVDKKTKAYKGEEEFKKVPKEDNLASMRIGQCDSSFKCTIGNDDKNHGMVACLSVPGDGMYNVLLLHVFNFLFFFYSYLVVMLSSSRVYRSFPFNPEQGKGVTCCGYYCS